MIRIRRWVRLIGRTLVLAVAGCGPAVVRVNASSVPVGQAVRLPAHLTSPDGKTPFNFIILAHDGTGLHAYSVRAPDCGALKMVNRPDGKIIKDGCSGTGWSLGGKRLFGPERTLATLPVQVKGSEVLVRMPG